MEDKNGMVVTSRFIKGKVKDKFGVNINSVIPSDFCYNRVNDGIYFRKDTDFSSTLGEMRTNNLVRTTHIPVRSGHKRYRSKAEIIVGSWVNGNLKYPTVKS